MATLIPTMSLIGWTGTPHEKAAYMIGCFLAANYSQSTALYGKITTLQYLVKKHANRLSDLETELRTVFQEKVNAVFPDTAISNVVVEQVDENNPAVFSIRLSCDITENGRTYTIGKLVQYNNSIMVKISDYVNG